MSQSGNRKDYQAKFTTLKQCNSCGTIHISNKLCTESNGESDTTDPAESSGVEEEEVVAFSGQDFLSSGQGSQPYS